MRIERVEIRAYKNLVNFVIDFSDSGINAILIGENGSGKSNLIEAIVRIFRALDLGEMPPFVYALRYFCRGMLIEIHADAGSSRPYSIVQFREGSETALEYEYFQSKKDYYLPAYIFAYYSGPSKRLESLFQSHREHWDTSLEEDEDGPRALPRLFYCKPAHSRLALLTYFVQGISDGDFLREYFKVEGFDSATVVIGPPSTRHGRGDRFWGVRGRVNAFLTQAWDAALAPMSIGGGEERRMCLYFPGEAAIRQLQTEPDESMLSQVVDTKRTSLQVFSLFDALMSYGMLRDVQIRVRCGRNSLPFAELSEGEQQFLTVVSLLRFTQEQESLFLLDEPDTHLNPKWKIDYLRQLKRAAGSDKTNQLILSTHDPLTIADLTKEEVHIFSRIRDGGRVEVERPLEDPRGLGVSGVLTEMFGLSTTLDSTTQRLLDERDTLAFRVDSSENPLDSNELSRLQELSRTLRHMGFVDERRDPVEQRILTMIRQWQRENSRLLSKAPVNEQRAVTLNFVREVLGGKG